jgi:hypothetical protein
VRSFITNLATEGDYITPHELNEEWAEIIGAVHGLDRDNVDDATLTAAKVELDAWNIIKTSARTTMRQTSHGESHSKGVIIAVPDEAGTGTWSLSITCGDGMLELGASVALFKSAPGASSASVSIGIRVDGTVIAWSPLDSAFRSSPIVDACAFVGAGTHLVEVVFTHHSSGAAGVTEVIDWRAGLLWARGVMR